MKIDTFKIVNGLYEIVSEMAIALTAVFAFFACYCSVIFSFLYALENHPALMGRDFVILWDIGINAIGYFIVLVFVTRIIKKRLDKIHGEKRVVVVECPKCHNGWKLPKNAQDPRCEKCNMGLSFIKILS